jgi:pimeloyl-ACP methyl ester carboxylesterase
MEWFKKVTLFALLYLGASASKAIANDGSPQASKNAVENPDSPMCSLDKIVSSLQGCLITPENPNKPQENQIGIYYRWYKPFDINKPTLIFLNGGPGGQLEDYLPVFQNIESSFKNINVLFYDQRGSGRSSYASEEIAHNGRIEHYRIQNHLKDMDDLRKKVIKQNKISIMGHSFGAHLAYGYAAQYPANVKEIYALNGSTDYLGTLLQPLSKKKIVQEIFSQFTPSQIDSMLRKMEEGQVKDTDGKTLSYAQFLDFIRDGLKTHRGQANDISEKITYFLKQKEDSLAGGSSGSGQKAAERFATTEVESGTGSRESKTVTLFIDCFELLTESIVNGLPNSPTKISALNFRKKQCEPTFKSPYQETVFDAKNALRAIKIPILMVGGTSDVFIPPSVQMRDYAYLSPTNPQVSLVILQATGHDPIYEKPECLQSVLKQFQAATSKGFKLLNCEAM